MSKYLKSGPSRYLISQRIDKPETAISTVPDRTVMVRNSTGYTDDDERLFDELNSAQQFSINAPRTQHGEAPRYTTPYTNQDRNLFDRLFSGKPSSEHATIEPGNKSSGTKSMKIMEFDDQLSSSEKSNPAVSPLSNSVRYYDR